MSDFLMPGGDDKNLGENVDWEARVQNVEGQFCDSQLHFPVI